MLIGPLERINAISPMKRWLRGKKSDFKNPNTHTDTEGTYIELEEATTKNKSTNHRSKHTDEDGANWRPHTLRKPFLASFVTAFVVLLIIVELLIQKVDREGAIIFDAPGGTQQAPQRAVIAFSSYIPIIISVVLGLFWAELDHDVKRLEPYFQLSRNDGATAKDSLLLEYPYCIAGIVPFIAFRRGHWSVFFSGTGLVVFLAIATPLMSAGFQRREVLRTVEIEVEVGELIPLNQQHNTLSTKFAHLAHELLWLNRTTAIPGFATEDFAILPFKTTGRDESTSHEHWRGETFAISADLECEGSSVESAQRGNISGIEITSNSGDCSFLLGSVRNGERDWFDENFVFNFSAPYNTMFIGQSPVIGLDQRRLRNDPYSLSSPLRANCRNRNKFLGIWDASEYRMNRTDVDYSVPGNWTAVFCTPKYWKQAVRASISPDTGRVVHSFPIGNKEPLQGLNTTFFEKFVGIGSRQPPIPSDLDPDGQRNKFGVYANGFPLTGYQLRQRFGTINNDTEARIRLLNGRSLSTYALAQENDLDKFLDPGNLIESYRKAYRLLFAFAVATELSWVNTNSGPATTTTKVERTFQSIALTLNIMWCRMLEAVFGVLILITTGLLLYSTRRRSNLDGEPASLANMMMHISRSPGFSEDFRDMEHVTTAEMRKILIAKNNRYKLYFDKETGPRLDRIAKSLPQNPDEVNFASQFTLLEKKIRMMKPKSSSWELSRWMGGIVLSLLLGLLILLACLYAWHKQRNGLPSTFGEKGIAFAILFNYLPTSVAMLIEPFWVILGRYTCMVGGYETLRKGNARISRSLNVSFEKSAPHLQLVPAIKSGNILLGALASAILLANFLAVALSGLFLPFRVQQIHNVALFKNDSILLKDNDLDWVQPEKEMFYVLLEHVGGTAPLPPWTSAQNYFLPFGERDFCKEANCSSGSQLKGNTIGYGSSVQCELLSKKQMSWRTDPNHLDINHECVKNHTFLNGNTMNFFRQRYGENNTQPGFDWWPLPPWDYDGNFEQLSSEQQHLALARLSSSSVDFLEALPTCPGSFLMGWGQQIPSNPPTSSIYTSFQSSLAASTQPTADYEVLFCSQEFTTANYSVLVDENSIVMAANRTSDVKVINRTFPARLGHPGSTWTFPQFFQHIINLLGVYVRPSPDFVFHADYIGNDTNPVFWPSYLMYRASPSLRRTETARNHLPNTENLVQTFEKIYKQMFAVYLSLHSADLFSPGPAPPRKFNGQAISSDIRVAMSKPMFYLAVLILGFFVIVTIGLYTITPGKHLVHLPTTLAATYALVYDSNALHEMSALACELKDGGGVGWGERQNALMRLSGRYAYGWNIGRSGEWRFGVYKEGPANKERGGVMMKGFEAERGGRAMQGKPF